LTFHVARLGDLREPAAQPPYGIAVTQVRLGGDGKAYYDK
jgi:hypothetical protein